MAGHVAVPACPSGRPRRFHLSGGHVGHVVRMYSIPPSPPLRTTCQGPAASGTRARSSNLPPPTPCMHPGPPGAVTRPPQPPALPILQPLPKPHGFPHLASSIQLSPRTLPPHPTPLRSPDPAPHAGSSGLSIHPPTLRREDPFAKRVGGPAAPVLWVAGEALLPAERRRRALQPPVAERSVAEGGPCAARPGGGGAPAPPRSLPLPILPSSVGGKGQWRAGRVWGGGASAAGTRVRSRTIGVSPGPNEIGLKGGGFPMARRRSARKEAEEEEAVNVWIAPIVVSILVAFFLPILPNAATVWQGLQSFFP